MLCPLLGTPGQLLPEGQRSPPQKGDTTLLLGAQSEGKHLVCPQGAQSERGDMACPQRAQTEVTYLGVQIIQETVI